MRIGFLFFAFAMGIMPVAATAQPRDPPEPRDECVRQRAQFQAEARAALRNASDAEIAAEVQKQMRLCADDERARVREERLERRGSQEERVLERQNRR